MTEGTSSALGQRSVKALVRHAAEFSIGFPPKYGAAVVLRRGVTPRRGQAASTAALRGLRNDAGGRMVLGSQVA